MRKIYKSVVVFVLGLITQQTQAQVGIGTTTPNNHSILELSATDKGLLVPRLSQFERNAMSLSVADKGMMIFNTTFTRFEFWDGAAWVAVGVPADNLGNHMVAQNIQLGPYYLSSNGMSEGLRIGSGGVANISTSTLPVASPLLTLYTSVSGVSMKMKPNALSVLGSTLSFDTESDQPIYFKTGGTTDMTLDASGNLGIGNPLPAYKLDVNGDINIASTGKLRVGGTAGTTGQVLGINASGNMQWATPSGGADNLGNHTASQNLDLNGYNVTSSGSITFNVAGTDLLNLNSSTFAISSMAGQFRGITGSVSTPSFAFATNANTGLYNPSAGQMAVTLNGVESTRFTGTGVGIGTISPTQKLQVVGNVLLSNAGTASELRLAEPSASGNNYTALRATVQTADITYTFPDVAPTTGQVLSSDASGNMSWITAGGSGNVTVASGSANYIPKWTTANTLSNTSSIFDNGNVGIGTNAPLGKLHVLGDSYFTSSSGFYFTQNTSIGNGYFTMIYNPDVLGSGAPTQTFQFTPRNNANTGTVPTAEYTMGKYASALGGYHAFSTRNSSNVLAERVRIDSDGNVGIGTPAPPSLLSVGTSGNGFQVNNTGNIVSLNGVTTNFPSANASGVLTNDGTGTLVWGTPPPPAITASNGLTATGTNIQLGGTLANATTINQSTNNLFFTNGNIGVGSGNINMMAADRALTVSAVAIGVENKNAALDLVGNAGSYNSNTAAINFVGIQPITNIVARRAMISALSGANATANGQLAFYTYNGTLNEVMRLTEGRRVAIGTTTPTARLEVVENVAGSFLDTLSKISHIGSSTWSAHRVALNVETKGSWSGGNSTALNVRVSGSVINYAALFNGGNVGIGTVAPAQLLSVGGTSGFQVNNDGNIVKINGATTNFPLANSAGALSNDGAGNLTWQPLSPLNGLSMSGANPVLGGTLTMNTTITQASYNLSFTGGKVGIGTTAPTSPLTVNGSVAFPIKTAPNGAYTFADTDFTVIRAVGNTGAFTLPAASTCSGRIYTVVNQSASAITVSSYLGLNGSGSTTVAATSSVMLQSNGTYWYQIK